MLIYRSDCSNSVLRLMYPFQWQHMLVPMLPPDSIGVIHLKKPYILGTLEGSGFNPHFRRFVCSPCLPLFCLSSFDCPELDPRSSRSFANRCECDGVEAGDASAA